jgi:ferredoxin
MARCPKGTTRLAGLLKRRPARNRLEAPVPVVVFESPDRPAREVQAPRGGRLVDICDNESAPVPFSCRSASCGTCRVDILEGAELLEAPADDELEVLDIFGDDPTRRRLACQMCLRGGDGRLRIRPCE